MGTVGWLAATGCKLITGDPNRIIALEISGTTQQSVEENDTLALSARALAANGDVVSGSSITWAVVDTGNVGFALDPATGRVAAVTPGKSGRVQAQVEDLRSDPVTIAVTPAPDSAAITGAPRVTLPASTAVSPPLTVSVFDVTTTPGAALLLAGKPVVFQVTAPPASGNQPYFLVQTPIDTVVPADLNRLTSTTAVGGQANAYVRRRPGDGPPDSLTVRATVATARGAPVTGSPFTFVVVFTN